MQLAQEQWPVNKNQLRETSLLEFGARIPFDVFFLVWSFQISLKPCSSAADAHFTTSATTSTRKIAAIAAGSRTLKN
jgi:hypothetical protein